MEKSIEYQYFMSSLTHQKDIKDSEKTKISVVFNNNTNTYCILRICKGRNLTDLCEALDKIKNPNAVVVYDYIYEDGDTYILEEFVSGKSIDEILKYDGLFSEKDTAKIIIDVCKALDELHSQKPPVVHNDIKPSNIIIRDDKSVKLIDFDISRRYKKGQLQNTDLYATQPYAAPEHYGFGQSEPRTDIYSLGVTMNEMLTGEVLSTEHQITYKGKMKKILNKCVEYNPKNRYTSVCALKKI